MDPCHSSRRFARRAFISASYLSTPDGRLCPELPNRCAYGDHAGGCVVRVHHWRDRKTGPQIPLLVAECLTHDCAFTLYPLGHAPYGRVAAVPADRHGELVRVASGGSEPGPAAWEQTIMGAAQDAAQGKAWPRSGGESVESSGCWRSQGRRIQVGAKILGLIGAEQSPLVGLLGVSALGHREATAAFGDASGYRSRGAAVCIVLAELQAASCSQLDLILQAGFNVHFAPILAF